LTLSRLMCDAGLGRRLAEAGARGIRERSNHRAMAKRMEDFSIEAAGRERPPRREQTVPSPAFALAARSTITGDGDGPVRITLRVHSEHNPESQAGRVWLKQVALARLRRAEPSDSPGQVAAGEDAI